MNNPFHSLSPAKRPYGMIGNSLLCIPSVFTFEWRRALSIPRLAWMLALAGFPPGLCAIIRAAAPREPPIEAIAVLVFILSPCVACMMGVFLWATPSLSSELEGRSWVYIAVRPYGPMTVVLGKFLVAATWAIPVGVASAILSVLILQDSPSKSLIFAECAIVVLSCTSYSALYLLIGVIAPKRCMVAGIIYTIIFEVAFALIPAAINLVTVQYRLRCLLVRWFDFDQNLAKRNPVFLSYFGDESAAWHTGVLLAMTGLYLIAAIVILQYREFTASIETES